MEYIIKKIIHQDHIKILNKIIMGRILKLDFMKKNELCFYA